MKWKLDRIISVATLAASLIAIILVLKRPAPAPQPQAAAATSERSQSPDQGTRQSDAEVQASPSQAVQPALTQAQSAYSRPSGATAGTASSTSASAGTEAHVNNDAVSAALAQVLGAAGTSGLTPDSEVGSGSPNIKDQQVTMDGDVVHGRFLTEIGGKDVWVTISGHMGEKDGYATFEPTEFKVGDLEVPVSLVNPALQRKLAEERDRLKVSDK
jgi:hypothetical protein